MAIVGLVGAGLIGRAWAIVFARAGHDVRLWDGIAGAAEESLAIVRTRLDAMREAGLVADPAAVLARIRPVATLKEAVVDAVYIQENTPEIVEMKRSIFTELDGLVRDDAILASSTSAILASKFTEELKGRGRCLVAHPANPPYLVPMVELSPAPWTTAETVERTSAFLANAGMVPVVLRKETRGFLLNRLQGALLSEAFRLIEDGVAGPEEIDNVIRHGLGLRWSFMGPLETIDLNAPLGVADYCRRYGPFYAEIRGDPPSAAPWSAELVAELEAFRRSKTAAEDLPARQAWRDRRLMYLAAHKAAMDARDRGE